MNKRYRLILIAAFALIASVCLIAGCKLSINKSFEDFVEESQVKSSVTYILNKGKFTNNSSVYNIYYPANAKPYEITQSTPAGATIGNARIDSFDGHEFLGWFEAKTNADGVPLYTDGTLFDTTLEEGKTVDSLETKYDFSKRLNEGDKIYVVARWNELPKITFKLIPDGFSTMKVDGKEYKAGDELVSYYIPSYGFPDMGEKVFAAQGYTFVSFHANADGSDKFTGWPVRIPEDGKDVEMYVKFMEGDWVLVRTATDFQKLFRSGGNALNYYFMLDDDKTELDCSELKNLAPLSRFRGKIEGNGCTVKNLNLTVNNISNGYVAAVFGELTSDASIKNITFENVTANYSLRRRADTNVFFMFSSNGGAKIENVAFGGQMNVTLGVEARLDKTSESNWIFGGYTTDSQMSGVTVLAGTKCTITDSEGKQTVYEYKN